MSHPLDGARLKVVRAKEHLNSLKSAVLKYKGLKPYVVSIEKSPDEWSGRADITEHPDPIVRRSSGTAFTTSVVRLITPCGRSLALVQAEFWSRPRMEMTEFTFPSAKTPLASLRRFLP